jgi:hypothetical protein
MGKGTTVDATCIPLSVLLEKDLQCSPLTFAAMVSQLESEGMLTNSTTTSLILAG